MYELPMNILFCVRNTFFPPLMYLYTITNTLVLFIRIQIGRLQSCDNHLLKKTLLGAETDAAILREPQQGTSICELQLL